jgi:hypothetical protein
MARLHAVMGSQWRRTDRIAGRSASWHGVQSSSLLPHARTAADPHQCFSVVRRRNFIAKTAMPFHREFSALGTDIVYDTGDYAGLLDEFRTGESDANPTSVSLSRQAPIRSFEFQPPIAGRSGQQVWALNGRSDDEHL